MKKFVVLILICVLALILIFCTSRNDIKRLTYEGISSSWKANVQFNMGNDSKIFINYIGSGEKPKKINFESEHLSGNTSGGVCGYSKTLNGFNIVFSNDDELNDNIEKYKNRKALKVIIEWDNQNEEIELKKIE